MSEGAPAAGRREGKGDFEQVCECTDIHGSEGGQNAAQQ